MIHQLRIALEKKFAPDSNNNTVLMMKLMGARETLINFNMAVELWTVNTAPWNIDFFLLSVPIDIDTDAIHNAATEVAAIAAANDQIDVAKVKKEVDFAINDHTTNQPGDRFPRDTYNSDDFRTIVDEYFVSAVHQKVKLMVPIVSATGIDPLDPDVVSTFLRRRFLIRTRRSFFYPKPSILILASRQPEHETQTTGPWDAAGLGEATEAEWKALSRPGFRRQSSDPGTENTIKYHIPWQPALDNGFETTAGKVLNCVGRGMITIGTNHPLAGRLT